MGVTTHLLETSGGPSIHLVLPCLDLLSQRYFFSPVNNKPPVSLSKQNVPADTWQSKQPLVSNMDSPFTPSLPLQLYSLMPQNSTVHASAFGLL